MWNWWWTKKIRKIALNIRRPTLCSFKIKIITIICHPSTNWRSSKSANLTAWVRTQLSLLFMGSKEGSPCSPIFLRSWPSSTTTQMELLKNPRDHRTANLIGPQRAILWGVWMWVRRGASLQLLGLIQGEVSTNLSIRVTSLRPIGLKRSRSCSIMKTITTRALTGSKSVAHQSPPSPPLSATINKDDQKDKLGQL